MNRASCASDAGAVVVAGVAARRLILLRRLALLCAVLVLAITSLSAFIRLSKAGLSCADWPQCYGQSLREIQQGRPAEAGEGVATAAARLAHRIVASTALLLVITMLAVCLTARPLLWQQGRVALALLVLALFLAVLGRWSSNARVPAVTIGNLLGGFAMLALCWRIAHRGGATASPRWLRAWAGVGVAMIACQAALGGLLSASFAATSCGSLADCLAASRELPWSVLDPWREPTLAAAPTINPSGALAQAVHRLGGVFVAVVLAPLGVMALRAGRRGAGAGLLALLAGALALGWLMAAEGPSLTVALAHNVVAALLLATAFELTRGADHEPVARRHNRG